MISFSRFFPLCRLNAPGYGDCLVYVLPLLCAVSVVIGWQWKNKKLMQCCSDICILVLKRWEKEQEDGDVEFPEYEALCSLC